MPKSHLQEYLRPHEVCQRFGISQPYLDKLIGAGQIRFITLPILSGKKTGRPQRRLLLTDLEKCFKLHCSKT